MKLPTIGSHSQLAGSLAGTLVLVQGVGDCPASRVQSVQQTPPRTGFTWALRDLLRARAQCLAARTRCSLNCPLPRCCVLPSWPSCCGVHRGEVASPPSLLEGGYRSPRMLLPFRCAFASSHLKLIDSQTHQRNEQQRNAALLTISALSLGALELACQRWFSRT